MCLRNTSPIAPGREGVGAGGQGLAVASAVLGRAGAFSPRCWDATLSRLNRDDGKPVAREPAAGLDRGLPEATLHLAGASAPALLACVVPHDGRHSDATRSYRTRGHLAARRKSGAFTC